MTHPWSLSFQPIALADYILDDDGSLEKWDVAIPQGSADGAGPVKIKLFDQEIFITPELRSLERDVTIKNMLRVNGHHVRVGSGGCAKIGLDSGTIKAIRAQGGKITDKSYLIKERKPILLIHVLKKNKDSAEDIPDTLFALGIGFPDNGTKKTANYMVNVNELKNWVDIEDEDDDDEDNR